MLADLGFSRVSWLVFHWVSRL